MVPQQARRRRRRAAGARTGERRVVVSRGVGGFGFTIAGQRPCVVSAVAAGGPAARAGLRAGDALLAVDGASVSRAPHAAVARLVAGAPAHIALSVAHAPTDTEDTEPDDRARTRRRHPPPRRRPNNTHHPGCHAAPSTSGVNEILQNLSRGQVTASEAARLECRAVVGYLGTIETPQGAAGTVPAQVRAAVRKLRQERRAAAPVLLAVLPARLALRRPAGHELAHYSRERIVFAGCGSDADMRYFGLVTAAEASHSCHVFAVDPRAAPHDAHVERAREFRITCTRDPVAERCLEFPPSAEYVVGVVRGMYSLPAAPASPPLLPLAALAHRTHTPPAAPLARCARPAARRRPRLDPPDCVANSPQPSNHSEITTTSSNSDSGIGFHNDGRNVADRILVVEFAGARAPPGRLRAEAPRRPLGLVGCGAFDPDGAFLSNTTPVVEGFGGQGRPLDLDDALLGEVQGRPAPLARPGDDAYNYNIYGNLPAGGRCEAAGYECAEGLAEGDPPQLDVDLELDHVSESLSLVEVCSGGGGRSGEWAGAGAGSADSVSVYSARSHEEAREWRAPAAPRLQASLDDMLVLHNNRNNHDEHNFIHPATVKYKVRKSLKPLNLLCRRREVGGGGGARARALSASADEVSAPRPDPLAQAASEPDLRDNQSEQSSPFRRWTTGSGAGSSYRHHDHRNMYNKQISEGSVSRSDASDASGVSAGGGGGGASKVARWSLGLEHLLADPAGAAAFAHFLNKEFAVENIKFWWLCEQYKCLEASARGAAAAHIWRCHLGEEAPEPVNVDAPARQHAATLMHHDPPPPDIFNQAQKQIFNVMKFDSYPRFLRSGVHAECARTELRGLPPPYPPYQPLSALHTDNTHTKLKKSASNASERRRSGGGSLLPWRFRPASRDRQTTNTDNNNCASKPVVGAGLCRVVLPDGATSVVGAEGALHALVDRLLARRNIPCKHYDILLKDPQEGERCVVGADAPAALVSGREVVVEPRCVVRAAVRGRPVAVRCAPQRPLAHVLRRLAAQYTLGELTATNHGAPIHPDTVMQELDGCTIQVHETSGGEGGGGAEAEWEAPGGSAGSADSGVRVRAALRPAPDMHHHPPDFLDNLRETQRQRLQKEAVRSPPPPLPPKPRPAPALV